MCEKDVRRGRRILPERHEDHMTVAAGHERGLALVHPNEMEIVVRAARRTVPGRGLARQHQRGREPDQEET